MIPREKWNACREDYIRGAGSLAALSSTHGLAKSSLEKRARDEKWGSLRAQYESAQLGKLIPPLAPQLETPAAPDGAITTEWLESRLQIHYHKTSDLLDKARTLLDTNLASDKKPGPDELAKLCNAINSLVTAESQLLGLKGRNAKPPKRQFQNYGPVE